MKALGREEGKERTKKKKKKGSWLFLFYFRYLCLMGLRKSIVGWCFCLFSISSPVFDKRLVTRLNGENFLSFSTPSLSLHTHTDTTCDYFVCEYVQPRPIPCGERLHSEFVYVSLRCCRED